VVVLIPRGLRVPALAALVAVLLAAPSTSHARLTHEYDLEAAFLFHFAQFVQWPSEALPEKNTPLTIGILGEDPFGKSLDEIVANESVAGHKLLVRRLQRVSQADSCHILFVSSSEKGRLDQILARVKRRSVLTVGETKQFAQRSGMIGFVVADKRLRLAINLAAANEAGLTISSKLLRQSEIVGPVRETE
jgi:hypothetical protein